MTGSSSSRAASFGWRGGCRRRGHRSWAGAALGRLQAKVEQEIGDKDLDARYNLGIAYKEMGLLDESVTEFRLAMSKPELHVGAGWLLADTLADRGAMDGAIAGLHEILS